MRRIGAVLGFGLFWPLAGPLCLLVSGCAGNELVEDESAFDASTPPAGTAELGKADGAQLAGKVGLSLMSLLSARFDCDAALAAFGGAPIAFGYLAVRYD